MSEQVAGDVMTVTERCGEHDLPKPCAKCALLCPCGCDAFRDAVGEEQWQAVVHLADAWRGAVAERDALQALIAEAFTPSEGQTSTVVWFEGWIERLRATARGQ